MSRFVPVLALFAVACGGGDREWSFSDVLAVDAGLSNGSLVVHSDARDDVHVAWSGGGVGRKAMRPDVFVEDGVLTVDAMAGLMSGADITIAVPEGLPVRGRVERGDLCVEMEEPSHIDACVAAGSVYIGVPEGEYRLALDVGAGDVSVDGVVHSDTASRVIHGCVAAGDLSVYALPESDESFGGSR